MAEVTPNTEIRILFRDLPTVMQNLSGILDMDEAWKKLAENVPTSKTDPTPLYRLNDLQLMKKSNDGPTVALLTDWGTHGKKGERPTIEYVIELLCKCELYRAADYLAVNILKGDPVERNILPTNAEIERLQLAREDVEVKSEFMEFDSKLHQGTYRENSGDYSEDRADAGKAVVFKGQQRDSDNATYAGSNVFTQPINSAVSMDVGGDGTRRITPRSPQHETFDSNSESPSVQPNINLPTSNVPHCSYNDLEAMTNGFNKSNVSDGGRRLGSGAFSTVFLGIWKNMHSGTTRNVAVKKMDTKFTEQFLMEVNLMSSFQHRCILQLFAYSMNGPNCCLVYEYMVNGSLQDRLARVNNTPKLPWQVRLHIAADTAQGLVSLHSQGYVHRDVKSANILLDSDLKAKLGDFGIAHIAPDPARYTSLETKVPIGTSVYMPREAFSGTITTKIDTYSFGVVLLEILTGRKPYDLDTKEDLVSFVEDEEIQTDTIGKYLDTNGGNWELDVAKDIFSLSEKCLQDKRHKRPHMFEVMPELLKIIRKISQGGENFVAMLDSEAGATSGRIPVEV